ncbi:hypothetical protein KXS07_37350, partial [Inquilinus limosus]|uniref:hypothetical protein n=1 Tax=Inquilinus limosus TaxID=171674 RepID=UPI003F18D5E9
QYGDASSAPKDTTADNGDQTDAQDETEEPSIWDSLWSRHFSGTIANTMTFYAGTNVNYSTRMSCSVNTSLDLSVSTAAAYRFVGGLDITQYPSRYTACTLAGDGAIGLGTEGSYSPTGQTFFTPGTIVLGSRPPHRESGMPSLAAVNAALLAKTQFAVRLASYAAKLTALADVVGTRFIKGVPQSVFDWPAAIMARLAAPAATTAAALMAKSIVGSYKNIHRDRMALNPDSDPTIKIEPDAITLRVGTSSIGITATTISLRADHISLTGSRSKLSLAEQYIQLQIQTTMDTSVIRLDEAGNLGIAADNFYLNGKTHLRGDCGVDGNVTARKVKTDPTYGDISYRMDMNPRYERYEQDTEYPEVQG